VVKIGDGLSRRALKPPPHIEVASPCTRAVAVQATASELPGPPRPPVLRRSVGATSPALDLDSLLMLPPASASSAAAPPGLAPPRLNCIGGEKRGRGRERNEEKRRKKLREEKKRKEEEKKIGEKKERKKERERKK
jgi:hypothetical protein